MGLGPVMLDLVGTTITDQERELLRHPLAGGVILFTRNFESVGQVRELIEEIHSLRDPHLLVAIDHEGGRVQRFREGFTHIPTARSIGAIYDQDRNRGKELAYTCGWLLASELRSIGVDFSFAPVLDLAHGVSGVIGDRAWHHDPEAVAILAHRFMSGMQKAGMEAVGKHFPGHGGVKEDSHLALPIDERTEDQIREHDLIPFERMIHYGLAGIMPAHVIYSRIDQNLAGFSAYWLNGVLRHELGFDGVIFSDDLSMAAAEKAGSYTERARAALDAGCDMVLVCNHPEAAAEVLEGLGKYDNTVSRVRLARMHGRKGVPYAALRETDEWKQAVLAITELDDSPNLEMNV
jgi:beta-N-acetylhexosaminidase